MAIIKQCLICKKKFKTKFNIIKNGHGKYCSRKCCGMSISINNTGANNPRYIFTKEIKCLTCSKSFRRRPSQSDSKYCSQKCFGISKEGKLLSKEHKRKLREAHKKNPLFGNKNPMYRDGRKNSQQGYISVLAHGHPFSVKNYVLEHHLVMEKHIGRYLRPEEVVHHKGDKYPLGSIKNKQDNRIENLILFANQAAHMKHHNPNGF